MKRELPGSVRVLVAPDPLRFLVAALVGSALVASIAAVAGVARVLPILLDPQVPWRAARPFLFGVLSLACEVGLLVGWSLGFCEAAVRSCERGEARARMALGEAPIARVARLWPAIALLSLLTAAASLAWGRDARAPGRVARALIEQSRAACAQRKVPSVAEAPLIRATWLCRPGEEPLLLGEGAGAMQLDFVASSLTLSDDLTSLEATRVQALLPSGDPPPRLVVGRVRVLHLAPFSAPSSVPAAARALLMLLSALGSAIVATVFALAGEGGRPLAWAVALVGPAAALAILRACERAAIADLRLAVVPAGALGAAIVARALIAWAAARYAARR